MRYFIGALFIMSVFAVAKGQAEETVIKAENGFELKPEENLIIAYGPAVVEKGNASLKAKKLKGYYKNNEKGKRDFQKLIAIGAVEINAPEGKAYGELGVYDIEKEEITLTGNNLKIVTPEGFLTAKNSLKYFPTKHMAIAEGKVFVQEKETQLQAEKLTAYFGKGSAKESFHLTRLEAEKDVIIITPDQVLSGNKGTYDANLKKVFLEGKVSISDKELKDEARGNYLESDLETKTTKLLGSSPSKNTRGKPKRVSALIRLKGDQSPSFLKRNSKGTREKELTVEKK